MPQGRETQKSPSRANAVKIIQKGPTIGAEIQGVDFARPVDDATAQVIHQALMRHKLVYFCDVEITPERHVALGRQFGELTVHPFVPHLDDFPEVMVLDNHKDNPVFSTDIWHTDETFRVSPPAGSILRCVTLPQTGGDTLWADMGAAYNGLSDKMQRFLSGLEAVHDFQNFRHKFDHLPIREKHEKLAKMEEELPNPTHPVVFVHPVTKQKILYVNEQFTVRIKDMRDDESRATLNLLFTLPRIPEYQFRFRWQENSMVFWDNRSTQHYAANDYFPQRRTMHRVTVKNERQFRRAKI